MALKKTFFTSTQIEVADAYLRVDHLLIQEKTHLSYRVRVYQGLDAKFPIEEVPLSCAYDLAGKNPIAQAYEHVKSLPEFTDAVDC